MFKKVSFLLVFVIAVVIAFILFNNSEEQVNVPQNQIASEKQTKEEKAENQEEKEAVPAIKEPTKQEVSKIEKKVKEEKPLKEEKREDADIHIVGLGDSLTQGVGDLNNEGYIGIIKEKMEKESNLRIALHNHAKRGQRSDQLLKRLNKEEFSEDISEANFIFLTIGGNDVMRVFKNNFFNLNLGLFERESVDFQNNLQEILTILRSENPRAPIYMIGIFNPYLNYFSEIVEIGEVIRIWNETSRKVTSGFVDVHFVPISSIFADGEEPLLHDDFFHPNRYGYELIANKLLTQMQIEGDLVFVAQKVPEE